MLIRPAQSADIASLSEFWYDRMALLQQRHPHIRLLPDARAQWEAAASADLQRDGCIFLVAEGEADLLGCIVGAVLENQPGLAPRRYGQVQQLILDMHSPQRRQGTGARLVQALSEQFMQQGIRTMQVHAPHSSAVEQAFWRGMGAKTIASIFWMEL